jgi:hypothetical protein
MKRCTEENIGRMLHAYELGQLDPELQDAFEVHLLSCDYCFEQVSQFDEAASLLRTDSAVQRQVRSAAVVEEPWGSFFSRLSELLWPKKHLLLKPALIYLVVALLAFPAYIGIRQLGERPVNDVQSLLLTGTRSAGGREVTAGEPLVLMFRIDGAREGSKYRVVIQGANGRNIYYNSEFTNFNDREMATVLLYADVLSAGRYTIEVFVPGREQPVNQYEFSVE